MGRNPHDPRAPSSLYEEAVALTVRSTNEAVLEFYASLGYEVNEVATLGKFLTG